MKPRISLIRSATMIWKSLYAFIAMALVSQRKES